MSLGSLVRYDSRYDDAEDEIRDEDHNLLIKPPMEDGEHVKHAITDTAAGPGPLERLNKPRHQTSDTVAKPKSLVSYEDEYSDDDDDGDSTDGNDDAKDNKQTNSSKAKPAVVNLGLFDGTSVLSSAETEAAAGLNDSFVDSPKSSHEAVRLPPEPQGRCSKSLQEKIAKMIEKKKGGMNVNDYVQRKKEFRNPSIYEKLVTFIGIDEHGTNFPKRLYDPTIWGPESYYDALQKAQKDYHKEKEKEKNKRTQVDFITGTKKPGPQVPVALSVAEKKSKWDQKIAPPAKSQASTVQTAVKSNNKN